ncbi:unnamed protein product [Trichogramma brassicae]|uniref:Integrase catalytic domain-containing protein n=1 Tax=Trichogramma brassicae TaxID=86971 RepID=A0A6H5IWL2_9HYME|nr:unnamed protein product [Trichogramma brassicae]
MYINDSHWDTWIRYAIFSYNTSIHTTHGFTPHELIFARKARIPSEFTTTTISKTYNDILDDIARKLNITQREAHDKIIEAKKKSKAYYDLKINSKKKRGKNYHTEPCLLQLQRAHPPLNYSATRRYSRDDPKELPNAERKRHLCAIFLRETHGTSVRAKIPPSAHKKKGVKRQRKMSSDMKYLVIKNEVVFSDDDENHEEGADAPGEIGHAAEVGEAQAVSNDQVEAGFDPLDLRGVRVREHEEMAAHEAEGIEAAAAQEPVNQAAAQQEIAPQLRRVLYVKAIPLPVGQPRGATATWSLYNAVGEDMELLRRFREGRIRVTNERMRGKIHAQAVLITSPHAETVGLLCCGERVQATWGTGYRITHHHLVRYEADVRRVCRRLLRVSTRLSGTEPTAVAKQKHRLCTDGHLHRLRACAEAVQGKRKSGKLGCFIGPIVSALMSSPLWLRTSLPDLGSRGAPASVPTELSCNAENGVIGSWLHETRLVSRRTRYQNRSKNDNEKL